MTPAPVTTPSLTTPVEREGVHTLVTGVVSIVTGFVISVLIARTLGPAGKGMLDLATATTSLFSLVLGGSFAAGLTRLVAREGRVPTSLLGSLALVSVLAAGITLGVLYFAPAWSQRLGLLPESAETFWPLYIAACVFVSLLSGLARGALVGLQAMIAVNRFDLMMKVVSLGLFAALLVSSFGEVRTVALASLGASVLLVAAYGFALRGRFGPAPRSTPGELLHSSLPLHGANVLNFVTHRVDVFFVQAQHGAREVGLYSLAISLAQVLLIASNAFAQPLLPSMATQTDATLAGRSTAHVTRLYLAISVVGAIALAIMMTWALPLVFGRSFGPSLPPLLVLIPGIVAFGATNILISFFFGQGHTGFNLWLSLVGLVITLVGNLTLTPRYGAFGAALTSTLAYVAAGVLAVAGLVRLSRISVAEVLWPRGADLLELVGLLRRFRP